MKHLLTALICALIVPVFAQESDTDYIMYQTIHLSPKDGHRAELVEGIKSHNENYHQEGAQRVNVWNLMNGEDMGSMLWVKGPLTWTDMDSEHPKEDHMEDWWGAVTPHANMHSMNFWRVWDELTYMPEDFAPEVLVVRYFKIHNQKWNNLEHVFGSIVKLYQSESMDTGVQVMSNSANTGDGRDVAIIWFHKNYASFDVDRNFFDKYKEKYGMDRREYFENWNDIAEFQGMQIMRLNTNLSVGTGN